MIKLPEYHNVDDVKKALEEQRGRIKAAEAQLDMENAHMAAIRKMCPHQYTSRYSMGRDAGRCCDICGDWK